MSKGKIFKNILKNNSDVYSIQKMLYQLQKYTSVFLNLNIDNIFKILNLALHEKVNTKYVREEIVL